MAELGAGYAENGEDHVQSAELDEKSRRENDVLAAKVQAITEACRKSNLDNLVRLADSAGGLLNDQLRRSAWPLLLGCGKEEQLDEQDRESWMKLPQHRDEDQVQLDVNRAFVYYPSNETEKSIDARKAALYDLIAQVLRRHPILRYSQGYHDIVQVFLLVLGEHLAPLAVERISLLRIRDYMLPSLTPALKHLQLLPAILRSADAELAARLSQTTPFFALQATITLYAHDIQKYSDIARLFDFILAHEPVISIYLFASIIISRRSELLDVPIDEPDVLHFTLQKLPQTLDLDGLITQTLNLFQEYPPERLPGFVWWKLSSLSVLKTSRDLKKKQSLQDGEDLFYRQAREMKRQETQQKMLLFLYRNRNPIASVTAALLVGALSVWLRKSANDRWLWSLFWRTFDSTRSGR